MFLWASERRTLLKYETDPARVNEHQCWLFLKTYQNGTFLIPNKLNFFNALKRTISIFWNWTWNSKNWALILKNALHIFEVKFKFLAFEKQSQFSIFDDLLSKYRAKSFFFQRYRIQYLSTHSQQFFNKNHH